jgi:signal transduction histidine kinase
MRAPQPDDDDYDVHGALTLTLHPLLRRQLAGHAGPPEAWPPWFQRFSEAVNDAYVQSDVDRTLLERSLDLSSQELLQANSEMRAVIATFPDLFLWVSIDGTILGCRAQESADLVLSRRAQVGMRLGAIPDIDAAPKFEDALREVGAGARAATVEFSLDHQPARQFYEARLVRLDERQILVIVRNMTGRRLAAVALEQSVSVLKATLEATTDGILVVDPDGGVATHNQRLIELWKIPAGVLAAKLAAKDEGPARPALEHLLGQLANPDAFLARVRDLDRLPDAEGVDEVHLSDGRIFEWYSTPQRIAGTPVGRVWSFRDVSESRRSDQVLRERDEQLRQAQKMEAVGQLAGGIAHDFNNLLTAISGYTGLLLEQMDAADPLRGDVEEVRKAGESAASLTQQLLAFSRRQMLRPRILDLNSIVGRVSALLQRLIGEHIDLVSILAPSLHRVSVDPGQIEQIIVNLAVNARDAMPMGGTLTVETANFDIDEALARRHEGLAIGPGIRLTVHDTGIGISEENRLRIFEPFFTTKPKGEGSGLGLATVYGIVRQSGGLITVESQSGHGSTFSIYLPAARQDAEVTLAVVTPAAKGGTETILIAEDQPEVRAVTRDVLKRHGYRVVVADGGPQALEVVNDAPAIHLLLTDVVMPGMTGPELAVEMRRIRPGIKVLYASGYTGERLGHAEQEISRSFIPKPFTPAALLDKVREVLDRDEAVEPGTV